MKFKINDKVKLKPESINKYPDGHLNDKVLTIKKITKCSQHHRKDNNCDPECDSCVRFEGIMWEWCFVNSNFELAHLPMKPKKFNLYGNI